LTAKVKVCGITSFEDAALALDCGADALGFNFFPRSPRFIDPVQAKEIIHRLPPLLTSVGVFVNVPKPHKVADLARAAGIRVLQLHGDESSEYCQSLTDWTLIKALRISSKSILSDLENYPVQAFLLDARDDLLFGGTGKTFDWSLCQKIGKLRPLILAGGLNAANVGRAIQITRPYAVDVCSGVESAPGKKDKFKLKEFMEEVRNARM
jgi:phosphoribosylanthranilate isomerase